MSGPFAVAVLDDYQGVAHRFGDWAALGPEVEVTVFREHLGHDEDTIARALSPFDALAVMRERTPLPGSLLRRLPRLRLVATTGSANAAIDLAAAAECGVTVCGTEGRAGVAATVELTWGLILAAARQIPRHDAAIRAGGWQVGLGAGLRGRTLALVGLGNLGAAMVAPARAFGMRVTGWSRNLDPSRATALGVAAPGREEFFATADVLSVHVKLGPRSVGYVGAAELALLRPTALLVNTSRGPVVDTAALVAALRAGRLAGAALDVYDTEPLPAGHVLRDLPGVVLSPHAGYVTEDSYREYFPQLVEDVAAFLDGRPVRVLA